MEGEREGGREMEGGRDGGREGMGRYSQQFVFGREGGKNTCRWKVRVNGKEGRAT